MYVLSRSQIQFLVTYAPTVRFIIIATSKRLINRIAIIMLSAVWMVTLLFVLQSVTVVRLECTNGALLRAQCYTLSVNSFLLHGSQIGSVRVRCDHPATSYSWSKSDDGSTASAVLLDTSSEKYTVVDSNSLDISFSNVTGADGGLYRCVYGDSQGTTAELCVYVHDRAVFASCPHEYSGCSEEVPLSLTSGESATFDARVTYTRGGSCDFKQTITRIKLTKKNEKLNLSNTLLFTCSLDRGAPCIVNDDRLSLSRRDGLDFIFSLSNTRREDSGVYEVVVEGTHPATGSLTILKKSFRLNITRVSPVTPPPLSAPLGVQVLSCSIVTWYSPEVPVPCENNDETLNGYEVRFSYSNSELSQKNATKYVGANRTFYILTEEDKVAGDKSLVQVRGIYSGAVGEWSDKVPLLGCVSVPSNLKFDVYFVLNGTVYLNNSAIPLLGVGEGDHALQCRTSRDECCKSLPNRFGDFYYPNGTQVLNTKFGHGFYRNRGPKVIHLNRMVGITSPTGKYRCEIPDEVGAMKSIFINLMND